MSECGVDLLAFGPELDLLNSVSLGDVPLNQQPRLRTRLSKNAATMNGASGSVTGEIVHSPIQYP